MVNGCNVFKSNVPHLCLFRMKSSSPDASDSNDNLQLEGKLDFAQAGATLLLIS